MAKKSSFDVKTHILVPKHSKLNQKETKQLFDKLQITIRDLPRISVKDPAIAALDVQVGDIIKVERNSPTAGKAVYYRGVVNE